MSARQQEKRPASLDGMTSVEKMNSLQSRLMRIASPTSRGNQLKNVNKGMESRQDQEIQPLDPQAIPLPPSPDIEAIGNESSHDVQPLQAEESSLQVVDGTPEGLSPHNPLQALVDRINIILKQTSPSLQDGINKPDALEGWIRTMNGKVETTAADLKRMSEKLALQESRMEEIRDTHRLESSSSTKLINELKEQLSKSETNLSSHASQQIEIAQLRTDLSKSQTQAKEEEEKRSKAISLLKTVRQKLVKLEKEKEEAERVKDGDRQERQRMVENLEKLRGEREKEVSNLRAGFEKEAASLKDKYERDLAAKKAHWELELITTKASHAKEIANKVSRISTLEASVKSLQSTRQEQFQSLQAKQGEADRHRTEAEAMEARSKEQAFQLKEAQDRITVLEEELNASARGLALDVNPSSQGDVSAPSATAGISPADLSRLLAEAQAKAELKLSELRNAVARAEKDRLDSEEESSRHLQDRAKELERLRVVIREKDAEYAEAVRGRRERDEQISQVEQSKQSLRVQIVELREQVEKLDAERSKVMDLEVAINESKRAHAKELEAQNERLEEAKTTVAQLRSANKTLREEMRKVQSSVQLLEKQRNPGVGYWSGGNKPTIDAVVATGPVNGSDSGKTSGTQSPARVETPKGDEVEVNLEYLRNVILQFLEKEEMRPNLIRVLAVILRFTPQELRRLQARIGA